MPGAFQPNPPLKWTDVLDWKNVKWDNMFVDRDIETNQVHIRSRYLTDYDLDKFARKIYKIIRENTRIDISEDEFMQLLQEDDE